MLSCSPTYNNHAYSEPPMSYNLVEPQPDPYEDFQATQENSQPYQPYAEIPDAELKNYWGCFETVNPQPGDPKTYNFPVTQPVIEIGRGDNAARNRIIFNDIQVSNHHMTLTWDEELTVTIQDFSKNGTYVNDTRLESRVVTLLRNGDRVDFGRWGGPHLTFNFRFLAGPAKTEFEKNYNILLKIGSGSFGTVYKALDLRNGGKTVAIKHIVFRDASEANSPALKTEIQMLKVHGRNHANIVELQGVMYEKESAYLILEYVDIELLVYIGKNATEINEPMAQHLMDQLCGALKYLHNAFVVHRDLKPENVLITRDDPPVLKVADFGLATMSESLSGWFKTKGVGTRPYMAPEMFTLGAPASKYDARIDSWSVGSILFTFFAGEVMFPRLDEVDDAIEYDRRATYTPHILRLFQRDYEELSPQLIEFMKKLLLFSPTGRMSIADAYDHEWLRGYRPAVYTFDKSRQSHKQRELLPTHSYNPSSQPIDRPTHLTGKMRNYFQRIQQKLQNQGQPKALAELSRGGGTIRPAGSTGN